VANDPKLGRYRLAGQASNAKPQQALDG
jgi:hypothetical protein